MVAFQTTDLPASIDTVEKLAAWSLTVLNYLHPILTATEATGSAERVATAAPFYITADPSPKWRYIGRFSFVLNQQFQTGQAKIWANVEQLSTQSIPAAMKS